MLLLLMICASLAIEEMMIMGYDELRSILFNNKCVFIFFPPPSHFINISHKNKNVAILKSRTSFQFFVPHSVPPVVTDSELIFVWLHNQHTICLRLKFFYYLNWYITHILSLTLCDVRFQSTNILRRPCTSRQSASRSSRDEWTRW